MLSEMISAISLLYFGALVTSTGLLCMVAGAYLSPYGNSGAPNASIGFGLFGIGLVGIGCSMLDPIIFRLAGAVVVNSDSDRDGSDMEKPREPEAPLIDAVEGGGDNNSDMCTPLLTNDNGSDELTPKPNPQTEAIAFVSTFTYLGFLVGPPLIGGIAELFDGLRFAYLFCAIVALSICLFIPCVAKRVDSNYQSSLDHNV